MYILLCHREKDTVRNHFTLWFAFSFSRKSKLNSVALNIAWSILEIHLTRFKDRCYCDTIEQMFGDRIEIYSCNNKNKS